MRAILSAEVAALVELSAALVAADETTLDRFLERARANAAPARTEEAILQSYLFLGFPAALEAMKRWRAQAGSASASAAEAPEEGGPDAAVGTTPAWLQRGEEVCRRVYGENYERLRANVADIHPDLDRWMVMEGYGKVLGRPGLDLVARELCIVAQLTAARRQVQLHSHLRGALNAGATAGQVEAAVRIGLRHVEEPEWSRRVDQLWWRVRERWARRRRDAEEVE